MATKSSFITAIAGVVCLSLVSVSAFGATAIETDKLVIRDSGGHISPEHFKNIADKVEATFQNVIKFWSTDARVGRFGKIVVDLDNNSGPRGSYSFFLFRNEDGRRVRFVKVYGSLEQPQELAHKLTSAAFPNSDKLIRNMMGEVSERRFGNIQSFPECGFDTDYWVDAFLQVGQFVSLTKAGPRHEDWGMAVRNNRPVVNDRALQQALYAEAGSFAEFLIGKYGVDKMKQFNRRSVDTPRPWEQVYGVSLPQLQDDWLNQLKSKSTATDKGVVSSLARLLSDNPDTACAEARKLSDEQNNARNSSKKGHPPLD